MSLESLLEQWKHDPQIAENIIDWRQLPMRNSQTTTFPERMSPALVRALKESGIPALYLHQATAHDIIKQGSHLVVVTGTASGKTLCYNLPVIDHLQQDPSIRALYLFPTKALAHDQHSTLHQLLDKVAGKKRITASTYDGDTPQHTRRSIRENAHILLSNPDMLHLGILPHHTSWATFLQNLKYVVIDEIHVYRGVFGSHVANVLRRLRRIAQFYGAAPQFILTSATIANPVELASQLVEEPVHLVDNDGSARGPKHFLIYNPPIQNQDLGIRLSVLTESVNLSDDLLTHNVQSVLFCRSRRSVELTLSNLRRNALAPQKAVRGYRSGYLPKLRREIEHGIRSGDVRVVIATNALELGVDIGGMDAVLMAGYPGTITATWQQAGRAGRGSETALAILLTSSNPLDQFLAHHPEYFHDRTAEHALNNPDNLLILLDHLRCAAFELPFQGEITFGGLPPEELRDLLDFLAENSELYHSNGQYFWMSDRFPAQNVSLRSASAVRVLLQAMDEREDAWRTIGEVDLESAPWMVHPGAIYLHEGDSYRVYSLDLDRAIARLESFATDYYTQPKSETTVSILSTQNEESGEKCTKSYGELSVTTQVIGYHKIQWDSGEILDTIALDLPSLELRTTGYWITLSDKTVAQLRDEGLWSNDPINYGPNWQKQRKRARTRDDYRCQNCGLYEKDRELHVHHKTPFRAFANYIEANRLDNLVTLCPPCHRRTEAVVRVRSGLSGLAYALSNLAPLFLMCDVRDIGIHADSQSPIADGQPTVIIFDRVPAGIGFSERLFAIHDELLRSGFELVENCSCKDGCPSCVGPAGEGGFGGKPETLALFAALVGRE